MAQTNVLAQTLLLAIAVHGGLAYLQQSWYCHRLVPRFITYGVTPCTYPCLLVSHHVHPHIVVQHEPDGTPCMVPSGSHHARKMGTCRSSVCTQELHHKVLKRRKRFICLYTIARIYQLRKQRKNLQNKIGELQQQLARSNNHDIDNLPRRRPGSGETAGLGMGIAGPRFDEPSGSEHFGPVARGPIGLGLPGSGSGAPESTGVDGTGFAGSMNGETGSGARSDFPGACNGRYYVGSGETGADDDTSTRQVRIGGIRSGAVDVNSERSLDDITNIPGARGTGGERVTWHE